MNADEDLEMLEKWGKKVWEKGLGLSLCSKGRAGVFKLSAAWPETQLLEDMSSIVCAIAVVLVHKLLTSYLQIW